VTGCSTSKLDLRIEWLGLSGALTPCQFPPSGCQRSPGCRAHTATTSAAPALQEEEGGGRKDETTRNRLQSRYRNGRIPCWPSAETMDLSVLRLSWKRLRRASRGKTRRRVGYAEATKNRRGSQLADAAVGGGSCGGSRLRHAELLERLVEVLRLLRNLLANLHQLLGWHVLRRQISGHDVEQARARGVG
jgi:hypothetical protein